MARKEKKPEVEDLKDDKGRLMVQIKIYSAFKNYFDGPAYSISAENHSGPFDILPRHHNFMTLVSPCYMKIDAPTGKQSIPVNQALMHVKADKVVVFLDS